MYAIMDRELEAYSMNGVESVKYYERNKAHHLSEKYYSYGSVLVKMKRVKSAIEFNFKIKWRGFIYWKPEIRFRHECRINFLIFLFSITYNYRDIPDKVIKDHLGETGKVKSLVIK